MALTAILVLLGTYAGYATGRWHYWHNRARYAERINCGTPFVRAVPNLDRVEDHVLRLDSNVLPFTRPAK